MRLKILFISGLCSLFMACQSQQPGGGVVSDIADSPAAAASKAAISAQPQSVVEEPSDEAQAAILTPLPPVGGPFVYPTLYPSGGGGRGEHRLPCENNTSDCNDKNPCTVDVCIDDTCVNSFDESKTSFGSCEVDGHSCTAGKCVDINQVIFCYEQRREFLTGAEGCRDEDQCTADSCIETPIKLSGLPHKDAIGNTVLQNSYQCDYELEEGNPCFVEDACQPGVCTITGSGMPGDDFGISCVQLGNNAPQPYCPNTDNNICTTESCVVGTGCVSSPVMANTVCNDLDPCTTDDKCQTDPMTQGFYCFGTPKVAVLAVDGGCSDGDKCTPDSCSGGVCSHGSALQCFDTDNNVCTPEACNSSTGLCEAQAAVTGACDDSDPCTTNDMCQTDPMLNKIDCFGTPKVLLPTSAMGFDDNNPCTEDSCSLGVGGHEPITGPVGGLCVTNYEGICAQGSLQCIDGVLQADMCVPMFLPGEKEDSCINMNGLDDNCDGVVDDCSCPDLPANTTKRYVSTTGNDTTNNCTNPATPCATIAHAIAQSAAGDALELSAGTYNEWNIVIDKNLFIYGKGPSNTIVRSNGVAGNRVFFVNSNISANFCGLKITNGNNTNNAGGGGIGGPLFGNQSLTLTQCEVSNNQSTVAGGGISIIGGTLGVEQCKINSNTAPAGGGIYVRGTTVINNTTLDSNVVNLDNTSGGAAIKSDTITSNLTITNSTISNNTSTGDSNNGGALEAQGNFTMTNCTVSNNTGIGINSFGTNIADGNNSSISLSTIANNTGAGIDNHFGTKLTLTHTIVSGNGTNCIFPFFPFTSNLTSSGYNLDSGTTCGFTNVANHDQQNANADLGPLQNNGGLTFTQALGNSSSAIDGGNTSCDVTTDQRGYFRPINYEPGHNPIDTQTRCDIGAFERQPFE
jgi:hypothetical protein